MYTGTIRLNREHSFTAFYELYSQSVGYFLECTR